MIFSSRPYARYIPQHLDLGRGNLRGQIRRHAGIAPWRLVHFGKELRRPLFNFTDGTLLIIISLDTFGIGSGWVAEDPGWLVLTPRWYYGNMDDVLGSWSRYSMNWYSEDNTCFTMGDWEYSKTPTSSTS
ncbi:hypothetical protein CKAH01_05335 [Colletotrichum kahawae]|uniref:Uncharacterized protein n=1 Tax=Colletotrichum kahawae TaxID=34407 RepID=A0AAE0D5H9_COLKA|nr:hypothetical protein CKAH01_05335 [Colletotrichum kahawae]